MIGKSDLNKSFARFPQKISGRFLIILWSVIVLVSATINIYQARNHAETVAREQARTMFDHILLTRNWNALHGGVYVAITEHTQPNPYLKGPERDLVTEKGAKFTMINPAFMTRQVSELAIETKGVQFHITSLNPIRPQNTPTLWERSALERFEKGIKEIGEFLYDERLYRYMAPLFTIRECLRCHAEQGYKPGDIRGGISVTHPVTEILSNRDHTFYNTLVVHVVVIIMSCLAMVFYTRNQQRLQRLSVEKEGVEQANEFKRAFIANISHELRTPLNAIIGMSHILSEKKLEAGQQAYVKKISEAGKRLDTMINHMIDFSQLDAGTLELVVAPLQLRQLVQGSVALMQETAAKKGLSLDSEFEEGLPEWLLGDAKHIQQVLFHIIDNALKFTETGGIKVVVSSRPEDDKIHCLSIRIKDSGIGMKRSPEWVEKHDFTQISNFLTRAQGGMGIGLTMSRRLLALMGGNLQIKSDEGVGTTVTITLKLERARGEVHKGEISAGVAKESKPTPAEDGVGDSVEVEQQALSAAERKQLSEQLTALQAALNNDFSRAMEFLAAMVEQYQGSDFEGELGSLSEMMAGFDSDGVAALCRSMQERLS